MGKQQSGIIYYIHSMLHMFHIRAFVCVCACMHACPLQGVYRDCFLELSNEYIEIMILFAIHITLAGFKHYKDA